jgi:hypothetical protein
MWKLFLPWDAIKLLAEACFLAILFFNSSKNVKTYVVLLVCIDHETMKN